MLLYNLTVWRVMQKLHNHLLGFIVVSMSLTFFQLGHWRVRHEQIN